MAFSAFLTSWEHGTFCCSQRDDGCELEESELYSDYELVKELLHLQKGPAAGVTHLPGAQEATCHGQGDATFERAVSEDVENGLCTSDGSVREPLGPQGTSATDIVNKRILRRFLGECRATPVASREGTPSPREGTILTSAQGCSSSAAPCALHFLSGSPQCLFLPTAKAGLGVERKSLCNPSSHRCSLQSVDCPHYTTSSNGKSKLPWALEIIMNMPEGETFGLFLE